MRGETSAAYLDRLVQQALLEVCVGEMDKDMGFRNLLAPGGYSLDILRRIRWPHASDPPTLLPEEHVESRTDNAKNFRVSLVFSDVSSTLEWI